MVLFCHGRAQIPPSFKIDESQRYIDKSTISVFCDLLWIFLVGLLSTTFTCSSFKGNQSELPQGTSCNRRSWQQLASNDGPHRIESSAQFLFAKRRDVLQVVLSMAHGSSAEGDLVAAVWYVELQWIFSWTYIHIYIYMYIIIYIYTYLWTYLCLILMI